MFHARDDFRSRFKITAREFNRHARFLNNLSSGFGIKVHRPDEPSPGNPVSISLDQECIAEMMDGYAERVKKYPATDSTAAETDVAFVARALPEVVKFVEDEEDEDTSDAKDRIGKSSYAAPLDHQHSIPFWINPLVDGDNAANNVQSEDVYVPDADEDTSDLDTSGTSPYAARADHYHIFDSVGATATNLTVYHIYSPSGQSHVYAVPYTLTITNGIITEIATGTAFDTYHFYDPVTPTITNPTVS